MPKRFQNNLCTLRKFHWGDCGKRYHNSAIARRTGPTRLDTKKLAQMAKLSVPAIARLERGEVDPRANTLLRLQQCFESAGIEFTDNHGVRQKGESVQVEFWDGADCMDKFLDDYFLTLANTGTEGLLSGIDEAVFAAANSKHLTHNFKRMEKLGLKERILIRKSDKFIVGPPSTTTYHWISVDLWGQVPYVIYGNKLAVLFNGPPRRILVIENPSLAATYRRQFEALWEKSTPIPYSKGELEKISHQNLGLK